MKSLKFQPHLAEKILSGQKTSTWRLFDDKDLTVGDLVDMYENGASKPFARAQLTKIMEKQLGLLTDKDYEGREKFSNDQEMYETYRRYYGPSVGPKTSVKIIWFKLL